jgi:hypothetical protein
VLVAFGESVAAIRSGAAKLAVYSSVTAAAIFRCALATCF